MPNEELQTTQTDVTVVAPTTELETAAQSSSAGGEVLTDLSTREGETDFSFADTDVFKQGDVEYVKQEAVQPLIERSKSATHELTQLQPYRELGPIDGVKSKLAIADTFLKSFENGQAGYNFRPFLEFVAEENGETTLEDMFKDLLVYKPEGKETLANQWDKQRGLDPNRIPEYKQIDSLIATSGAITPEELAEINPVYHEAYRSLPDELRREFSTLSESMKLYHLNTAKEKIDALKAQELQTEKDQEDERRADAERTLTIQGRAWNKMQQIRQEKASEFINELRKYKFSNDPKTDAVNRGAAIALSLMAMEPLWRFAVEDAMKALNVTFDSTFDQRLETVVGKTFQAEQHREFGENSPLVNCETEVSTAIDLIIAKMAPIMVQIRKIMGAELAEKAKENGNQLSGATETVPFTSSGDSVTTRPAYSIADAAARAFDKSQPAGQ
jgi:hypothetical protein